MQGYYNHHTKRNHALVDRPGSANRILERIITQEAQELSTEACIKL
jgi:hypothetical protein